MGYLRDKLILVSFSAAAVANIILWAILFIKFGLSREIVPLHASVIYGIDLVGSSRNVYQIPALGLVIVILNLYLARLFFHYEKLLAYFLAVSSVAVQALLLVAGIALIII